MLPVGRGRIHTATQLKAYMPHRGSQEGKALVLPGFQLSPAGALAAIRAAGRRISAELAALQAAVDIITAGGLRQRAAACEG